MNEQKREIRTIDCQLSVREAEGSQAGESRTIAGTAIVFNAESEILDDWGERFREVILPEAATMEFLNSQDIKMNLLHDRRMTVARCNKGVGTLRLSVDERGVNFEFEAPKCDIGDRCLEMVRRGDYSGCSFEFYPKDYEIERDGEDVKITHKRFEFISALTIGLDPAYRQTSVNVREMTRGEENPGTAAGTTEGGTAAGAGLEAPGNGRKTAAGTAAREPGGEAHGTTAGTAEGATEGGTTEREKNADVEELERLAEEERVARELVAVANANRNRVRLMGRDLEDFCF